MCRFCRRFVPLFVYRFVCFFAARVFFAVRVPPRLNALAVVLFFVKINTSSPCDSNNVKNFAGIASNRRIFPFRPDAPYTVYAITPSGANKSAIRL